MGGGHDSKFLRQDRTYVGIGIISPENFLLFSCQKNFLPLDSAIIMSNVPYLPKHTTIRVEPAIVHVTR